jgi:hypothetical protein
MNSFEVPVTVATKASIFKVTFTLIQTFQRLEGTNAEVDRTTQPCIRSFLCAAANYEDDAKNNQDCQEPKQIACNWNRTLKITSLVH